MSGDESDLGLDVIFTDTPRPPSPKPTVATYVRDDREKLLEKDDWKEITIRLVGSHPLWGHHLWNAARAFASYLDSNPELYRGRCVLELGAGGGLPSIVTLKNGARKVVLTDYPDPELINNMKHNVTANFFDETIPERFGIQGYIWGQPIQSLLDELPEPDDQGFDLIILSDLVFNHSQHDSLLKTCRSALSSKKSTSATSPPTVLVFYTHHRPHLAHRDLEFFTKARDGGWTVDKILTERYSAMFPEDSGDEVVRSTVHGWKMVL